MSKFVAGFRRLTHHYDLGWSGLDQTQELGTFRILSIRHKAPSDAGLTFGSQGWDVLRVKVPDAISAHIVKQALLDTFSVGCRCEHDCCGHVQRYARNARKLNKREWRVFVDLRANV